MDFSHDTYMNKTFNELVNIIKVQDDLISKLNSKIQKKRTIIADLKKQIEDDNIIEVLFEEDSDDSSKPAFTDEQLTITMAFFNDNYQWLPGDLLNPDKRCLTSIKDIYDDLKEWGRCENIPVQGDNRQILTRPQLIQILREEHKNRYNNIIKWQTAKLEEESEQYPNGSRNLPYFHCMKKEI